MSPFRHIFATCYVNENLSHGTKESEEGTKYIKFTYPTFKLGEELVLEVSVPPT